MQRTVVALDYDIKHWLDHRAAQEGVPMTELVRRALREMRDREMQGVDQILASTSGLWGGGDGLEHQQAERDDWDRS